MSTLLRPYRIAACAVIALAGCAVAEESDPAADSNWSLDVDDSITWETVHVLSQTSQDSIPDEYATRQVTPTLELRCTAGGDGAISMRINWHRFISSFSTEAGFRVDDGQRDWLKLSVDDSNRITLSRSAADVVSLVASLSSGENLNVEIAPYSEPSVSVNFTLSGFETALSALNEACD